MESYAEILTKIKTAVIDDDVDSYKDSSALVSYVNKSLNDETIGKYQRNAYGSVGSVNLICLACKSAAVKVLEYILSEENNICSLPYLTKKGIACIEEEDDNSHNAIYYAIRSNNIEIPEIIFRIWLNGCFEENSDKLDDIISKAFKDLTVRNVYITEEMKMYIKSKLMDLRFFDKTLTRKKNTGNVSDIKTLRDLAILRLESVLENITYLTTQFFDLEPNEQFLLSSKYVAKNIHILKSSVRCKDRFPWEEIEFCLTIFIRSCQSCYQQYPLYTFVLNKKRLLSHLETFSRILMRLRDKIRTVNKSKLGKLVMDEIKGIEKVADFKELYDDFTQIRDLHSLEAVKSCIDLAKSADIAEKRDQLVIVRALQVIGECMKNSDDSPNLSADTYKLLLSSLPDNMKEVLAQLRNDLSHAEALFLRTEIETSGQNFFKNIQTEINEMSCLVATIICIKKDKIIRKMFSETMNCKGIDAMKLYLNQNHIFALPLQKELEEIEDLNPGMEQWKQLFLQLERDIDKGLNDSNELIRRIQNIVENVGSKSDAEGSLQSLKSLLPDDLEEREQICRDFVSLASISMETADAEKCKETLERVFKIGELKVVEDNFQKISLYSNVLILPEAVSEIRKVIENPSLEEEIKQFEKLVHVLKNYSDRKAIRLKEMFLKAYSLIESEEMDLTITKKKVIIFLEKLIFILKFDKETFVYSIDPLTVGFPSVLQRLWTTPYKTHFLINIKQMEIDIECELQKDNFAKKESFRNAIYNLSTFISFSMSQNQWIKEFKEILQSHKEQKILKSFKNITDLGDQLENLLSHKLSLIEKYVKDYHLNKQFFEKSQSSSEKLKLVSVIEMLTLDVMTILGCLKDRLTNNAFYLDSDYPILNGKNLRNHLAHGNALVSIVLGDEFEDLLLNADKMKTHNFLKSQLQIGKKIKNDPQRSKVSLNQDLSAINWQQELFLALTEGKMARVKDCFSKGADMLGRDFRSQTSLHFATKGPSLEIVKNVLKFNIDVCAVDIDLQTALHVASFNGRFDIVECLIEKLKEIHFINHEINRKDIRGRTPLHLASRNGHKNVVTYLLENGAKLVTRDCLDNVALNYAIIHNHVDVVSIFLEKQSMNTTICGASVLHLASQMGHKNLVETLLEKFNIKLRLDLHFVPLHYAARGGQTDIVEFLIAKDADVNAKILNGITPLHLAARRGHFAVVDLLIHHGAALNASDANGWTPLFLSLKGGFLETSKLLLEKGAIVDSVENALYSPLNFATVFGHLELVEVLFHKSDACSKISALHSAAFMGHLTIIELFINNGMNFDCENRCCNALHLAALEGHTDIVDFLISKGYDVNEKTVRNEDKNPIHGGQVSWPAATTFIGNSSDIDRFLQFISDLKAMLDDLEVTALHLSSYYRHKDIVRSLLKNKANVFIKDGKDSTAFQIIIAEGMSEILVEENIPDTFTNRGDCGPLYIAAEGGDLLIVKHCIARGCDVDARSESTNLTPLHRAVSYGHEEIINYLIECGANVNAVGGNGATALEIAILKNRKNIMCKLIDKNAEISAENEKKYLLSAIKLGHDDIVEYLLNRNPENGDSMPECYTSPLHTAVRLGLLNIVKKLIKLQKRKDFTGELCTASFKGHCEIARVLLSNGADPFASEPFSALDMAIFQGHSEMVEILIKSGTPITQRDHEGQSAIELAIDSNNLDVLETVLKLLKFDFSIKSPDGCTLLHHAAMGGSLQVVECLVEKGANVNERDFVGAKPIHVAAAKGHKDIVEYFLKEGIDIDDRDLANFSSLLHVAAARDGSEICGFLLKNGLDANIVDGDCRTPLHIAAGLGKENALRTLLQHGAFYDSCDERNLTPIDLATELGLNKYIATVALLELIPRLFSSVANNELPRALVLYSLFGRLSEVDCSSIRSARYISLLHCSVLEGYEGLAGFLLERSQNPDVRSPNGFTPLHFAALSSSLSIVNALLRKGAMFDAKSNFDITPVELATNRDIIKTLNFLNEVFLKVENGDSSVLDDLKNLDEKSAKTVLRARNSSGKTLIAFAVIKEFPKVESLKSLFQDDVILLLVAGVGLQREKRFEASIKLLDIVLGKRIDIFGTDDPGVMDVLEVIGMNFMYLENYDEGLTIIAKVYSIRKEVLGNCNEYTLNSMFIMATVLKYKGMENEALAMFEDLFEKQSSVLGSDSIETLTTQLEIAYLMHTGETESDKSAKSLSSCLEVLEKLNKIGDGEEIVSTLKLEIAHFLRRAGEPSVALDIFKVLFESAKAVFGLHHSFTSDMLFQLAFTLYVMDEMEDSLKAFRETLEIRDFVLGTNDEKTLNCRFWIANTLFFVGSHHEAYEMFKADLEGRAAVLGASHPKIIRTRETMDFIISRIVNE